MGIEMCRNIYLGVVDGVVPLEGGQKGTFVPANTTIRVMWYKAGAGTKNLFFQLEEFI
jgi:hypothetical protein